MTDRAETPLVNRDALARALYRLHAWSGCAGSDWDRVPELVRVEFRDQADALFTSGVVQTPAEYVAGLADDEALVDAVWEALDADGHNGLQCDPVYGTPTAANAIRALAAALTERTDRD